MDNQNPLNPQVPNSPLPPNPDSGLVVPVDQPNLAPPTLANQSSPLSPVSPVGSSAQPFVAQNNEPGLASTLFNVAQQVQSIQTSPVRNAFSALRAVLFAAIFIAAITYFIHKGLPIGIGIGLIIIVLVMAVGGILMNRKAHRSVQSATFDTGNKTAPQNSQTPTAVTAVGNNEQIIGSIAGIMRADFQGMNDKSLNNGSRFMAPEYQNAQYQYPENALIMTNSHLYFIYVALPGGDQELIGVNVHTLDFSFQKSKIEEKLNQLLASTPLQTIVNMDTRNFGLSLQELKEKKYINWEKKIKLETQDGRKFTYIIRDKADYERLGQWLGS